MARTKRGMRSIGKAINSLAVGIRLVSKDLRKAQEAVAELLIAVWVSLAMLGEVLRVLRQLW
jgi:hypothetical protein